MTEPAPRPWWASDPPVPADATDAADPGPTGPAEDPVVAHRAARRGGATDPDTAWWTDALTGVAELAEGLATSAAARSPGERDTPAGDAAGDRHDTDVCGVCPICTGMRVLRASHPELARHLTAAAHHLAAAARELVERPPGAARDDEDDGDAVERIDLD